MSIKCYVSSTKNEVADIDCIDSIEELQTLIDNDAIFENCSDFEETCGEILSIEFEVDGVEYEIVDGKLVKKND